MFKIKTNSAQCEVKFISLTKSVDIRHPRACRRPLRILIDNKSLAHCSGRAPISPGPDPADSQHYCDSVGSLTESDDHYQCNSGLTGHVKAARGVTSPGRVVTFRDRDTLRLAASPSSCGLRTADPVGEIMASKSNSATAGSALWPDRPARGPLRQHGPTKAKARPGRAAPTGPQAPGRARPGEHPRARLPPPRRA